MVVTRSVSRHLIKPSESSKNVGLATPSTSKASETEPNSAREHKKIRDVASTTSQCRKRKHIPEQRSSSEDRISSPKRPKTGRKSDKNRLNLFCFSSLPWHIQKEILEHLPWRDRIRLEKVCRSWCHFLRDAWRDVRKVDIPTTITDRLGIRPIDDIQVCGFLRKCGSNLRRIDFFFLHNHIADHVLYSVQHRCLALRELFLTTDIPGRNMNVLLKKYCNTIAPNLLEFSLSYHNERDKIHNGLRAAVREMGFLKGFRLDTFNMPPNVSSLFPSSPVMRQYALLLLQPGTADQSRWKFVTPNYLMEFFEYMSDMYPQLEELDVSLDTDVAVDEVRLYDYLKYLGRNRRIRRLNLRISYLFEEYDVWFGTTAIRAIKFFGNLTDLSLWSCILPTGILDVFDAGRIGDRLRKLRLSIVRGLSHDLLRAILARCQCLELFSLIYSSEDNFTCPRSITSDTLSPLFTNGLSARIRNLELMDCDTVDLKSLIMEAHARCHRPAAELPAGRDASLWSETSFGGETRLRDPLQRGETQARAASHGAETLSAPPLLEVTYKTNLKLRLRQITELQGNSGELCCVNVYKKRNTVFRVEMWRECIVGKD